MHACLGVVVLSLVGPAASSSPGSGPSVDQVLAHNLEARGGLARLKAIRSLRLTGTVVYGADADSRVEASWAFVAKRRGMARSETRRLREHSDELYGARLLSGSSTTPGPAR